MSTGIAEEVGRFVSASPSRSATRLELAASKVTEDVAIGDSISVNGCSLTLVEVGAGRIRNEMTPHTTAATTLEPKDRAALVNLEIDVVAKDVERLARGRHDHCNAPRKGRI